MARHLAALIAGVGLLLLVGCERQPPATPTATPPMANPAAAERAWLARRNEAFRALANSSQNLASKVDEMLAAPDAETLTLARDAWQTAHEDLIQARLFLDGRASMRLDSWPIAPGFIDAIPGYPDSGLINDVTLPITAETLIDQHGFSDETEASLGFHPVEFLLFEKRQEDYSGDEETTRRRRQYLEATMAILLTDIDAAREAPTAIVDDEPAVRLAALFGALYGRSTELFYEANQLDDGHGERSGTAIRNLRAATRMLVSLSGPDSELSAAMTKLDQAIAADYQQTLAMTVSALEPDAPGDEARVQLPLLYSALGHQLEDLMAICQRAR